MADQWTWRVSIRCQNANWYVRHMVVVAGPLCAFLLWWTHRTFSMWHYWIDNWSASTILGSFIFHYLFFPSSFLSAAQKKSLVFGVKILLSANLFAWLHISDNMIGLQKSIMVQIFSYWLGFPCMLQSLSTIYDIGCVHLTSYCTWGAREQRVWPMFLQPGGSLPGSNQVKSRTAWK